MYAMMQCKAKSENLAHILRYQIWAVTEVLVERVFLVGFDHDLVDVGLSIPSHLSPQSDPHEALESGTGIFQAEGHADVAKHTAKRASA